MVNSIYRVIVSNPAQKRLKAIIESKKEVRVLDFFHEKQNPAKLKRLKK